MCIRDRGGTLLGTTEFQLGQPCCPFGVGAVSYTHLDVYKRQGRTLGSFGVTGLANSEIGWIEHQTSAIFENENW